MNDPNGISWSGARGISWCAARGVSHKAVAAAGVVALVAPLMTGALKAPSVHTANPASELVSVIVRDVPGYAGQAERAVQHLGGAVGRHFGIIDGFSATVPADQVSNLEQAPGVQSVSANHAVKLMSVNTGDYNQAADPYSIFNTTTSTGAPSFWAAGYTGQGIGVAVIDSGVAPVDGLNGPGKVVYGPDLSTEADDPDLANFDTNGHGTHMAGIIAGRDAEATGNYVGDSSNFIGMAPDSKVISIKVADAYGNSDVSQVLAAIDWVVTHRNDPGNNIRVLNLSYGTDSQQDYVHDPLDYAAEAAWKKGIVVVAAAGNAGFAVGAKAPGLTDPASDPFVMAVGAVDNKGTVDNSDDVVAEFSSSSAGVHDRNPDLVAPGKSVTSLRVPGSYADQEYGATGGVTDRLMKGSGTSQATAVVSGAAALVLSQRPDATPDQVKAILTSTADLLPNTSVVSQGKGELDLAGALKAATPNAVQKWAAAKGDGSLGQARGSYVYDANGNVYKADADAWGNKFDAGKFRKSFGTGTGTFASMWVPAAPMVAQPAAVALAVGNGNGNGNANGLQGHSWSGHSWSGHSWSGHSWSGHSWSGHSWSDDSWG